MDLGLSEKLLGVRDKIEDFVFNKVEPVESEYHAEVSVGDRWSHTKRQEEILGDLKDEARKQGLWNFFLPESQGGAGISNLEYAHLAANRLRPIISAKCAYSRLEIPAPP